MSSFNVSSGSTPNPNAAPFQPPGATMDQSGSPTGSGGLQASSVVMRPSRGPEAWQPPSAGGSQPTASSAAATGGAATGMTPSSVLAGRGQPVPAATAAQPAAVYSQQTYLGPGGSVYRAVNAPQAQYAYYVQPAGVAYQTVAARPPQPHPFGVAQPAQGIVQGQTVGQLHPSQAAAAAQAAQTVAGRPAGQAMPIQATAAPAPPPASASLDVRRFIEESGKDLDRSTYQGWIIALAEGSAEARSFLDTYTDLIALSQVDNALNRQLL